MNPWFSMWFKPRLTIRQLIDAKRTGWSSGIEIPAALFGMSGALTSKSEQFLGSGDQYFVLLSAALMYGGIGGLVGLLIIPGILRWTGKWMGGQASTDNIRAAYAWSRIPYACILLGQLLIEVPFYNYTVAGSTPSLEDVGLTNTIILLILALVLILLWMWQFVIELKCLSEVQGFSVWIAAINWFVAVTPLVLLAVFLALLT